MKLSLTLAIALFLASLLAPAEDKVVPQSNGLAPEVPGLSLKDKLYQLEAQLPDLEEPFISVAPADKKDGLVVGKLGVDGGNRAMIEAFANDLAGAAKDEKVGNVDSLLIGYRGKLIFESYYRRGRANFPHYQMSITKSAAGSSILSRDMLKFGQLILGKGKWKGEQLIPEAYLVQATTPSQANERYGFFWWIEDFTVGGKTYHSFQGRGAGGQFIFMFPELDLATVVTSHNKGMGDTLKTLPERIIPAFIPN